MDKHISELKREFEEGRISRREFLRYAVLLGMSLGSAQALLAACAPAPPTATPTLAPMPTKVGPKRGGILNFGISYDPPRLDPQTHGFLGAIDVITSLVYDRLLDYTPDTSDFIPNLAEKWDISPDGKVYTFSLRKGIKWHNGKDVTAEDVKFTFERLLDPQTAAPLAPAFGTGTRIEAPDPYTVRVTLSAPNAGFLAIVATPPTSILSKEYVQAGNDPATTLMGSGPFKFKEWQPGVQVILVRNENYRVPGKPYLDGITFKMLPDESARVTALRTKAVDIIDFTPEAQMAALEATKDIVLYTDKKVSVIMFTMRQDPPFDNVKVRQALSCAVDREAVQQAAMFGRGAVVHGGVLWEGHWAHSPEVKQIYTYDPERAKKLLAEAGYPNGFKTSISSQVATRMKNSAVAIAAGLKAIGVDAEVMTYDTATIKQKQGVGDFEMTVEVVILTYADPDYLRGYLHSQSLWGRATKSQDKQLDTWLEQAVATTNREERKKLYTQVEQRVMETVPIVLLVRREWGDTAWNYVKDYMRYPGLAWQAERGADWWLDK